ncbi:hypothetical protein ES15_0615 [Cronobacter sakazakii ES15]|nr:hypothetical protein ES15_0615 [Cronobacter sakazakii ES15]
MPARLLLIHNALTHGHASAFLPALIAPVLFLSLSLPVTGVTEPAPLRALANRSLRYMTVRLAM